MIDIIKIALDALGGVVAQWINASAEERAELEKRVLEAVSVMKNERKQTHDEFAASDAETKRQIEEAKKQQGAGVLVADEEITKP